MIKRLLRYIIRNTVVNLTARKIAITEEGEKVVEFSVIVNYKEEELFRRSITINI